MIAQCRSFGAAWRSTAAHLAIVQDHQGVAGVPCRQRRHICACDAAGVNHQALAAGHIAGRACVGSEQNVHAKASPQRTPCMLVAAGHHNITVAHADAEALLSEHLHACAHTLPSLGAVQRRPSMRMMLMLSGAELYIVRTLHQHRGMRAWTAIEQGACIPRIASHVQTGPCQCCTRCSASARSTKRKRALLASCQEPGQPAAHQCLW